MAADTGCVRRSFDLQLRRCFTAEGAEFDPGLSRHRHIVGALPGRPGPVDDGMMGDDGRVGRDDVELTSWLGLGTTRRVEGQ